MHYSDRGTCQSILLVTAPKKRNGQQKHAPGNPHYPRHDAPRWPAGRRLRLHRFNAARAMMRLGWSRTQMVPKSVLVCGVSDGWPKSRAGTRLSPASLCSSSSFGPPSPLGSLKFPKISCEKKGLFALVYLWRIEVCAAPRWPCKRFNHVTRTRCNALTK